MYIIKDNNIIPVQAKSIVGLSDVLDVRVTHIEKIVAHNYNIPVHELTTFYRDSDAKVMCCFLLHDMFNYSIGSIAKRYHIDRLFLRTKIIRIYTDCLQSKNTLKQVLIFKDNYKNNKIDHLQAVQNEL